MAQEKVASQVVIHGGGAAGALLAKALSGIQVTLVDPNAYFEVPMSVPRSLLVPEFANQAIIPFATALPGVRHIQGSLTELQTEQGLVTAKAGGTIAVAGEIAVIATGSRFSNSLMRSVDGASVEQRKSFYRRFRQGLQGARKILIVGGGPIGVEVAGEISEHFADRQITLLEAGPRILAGTSAAAAQHTAKVLTGRGVKILVNQRLARAGSGSGEVFGAPGEAVTASGVTLPYDWLVWCIGGRPDTAYMRPHFEAVLNAAGQVRVTPQLRVVGQQRLFALGDITDLDENKMAWHITGQVEVAAHNIRALLQSSGTSARLKAYKPQTGNPMMAVTLGSREGVLQLPCLPLIRSPFINRMAKADNMLVRKYRKAFGL